MGGNISVSVPLHPDDKAKFNGTQIRMILKDLRTSEEIETQLASLLVTKNQTSLS